jgi:Mrp family chromosome partitioning ATPase
VRVKQVRERLAGVEKSLAEMEAANPRLVLRATPPAESGRTGLDLEAENARLAALQARLRILTTQLEAVRAEASALDQMEIEILQLTRLREQQVASYSELAAAMDRMRTNDALGSGSVTNINRVQNPSPPFVDNAKTKKISAAASVAGLALGLAWAFAIELFLDRSVRRPADLKRALSAPLFLSIPRLSRKQLKVASDSARLALPGPKGASTPPVGVPALAGGGNGQLAAWEAGHPLHAFHETLRDRLISYFESVNLTHKPKLVAVTGLGDHAGVTTTAAGLAASLSETGDGNVLLVDMTAGQGSAQQFYQGKAVCGLDEVLQARDSAQIESNLYVVGEEPKGERLSRILPHRFNKLVPQLKASNFDYIIFDMPPVSQISITPRLAGFMDMTLLVLESEKTDRDIAAQAADLLAQSKTHVGVVLNKTKSYIPKLLHQDREFLHGM